MVTGASNEVTRKDAYPLPRRDYTLGTLAGSKLFTTLDLRSGYWQVEMDNKDSSQGFNRRMGTLHHFGVTSALATAAGGLSLHSLTTIHDPSFTGSDIWAMIIISQRGGMSTALIGWAFLLDLRGTRSFPFARNSSSSPRLIVAFYLRRKSGPSMASDVRGLTTIVSTLKHSPARQNSTSAFLCTCNGDPSTLTSHCSWHGFSSSVFCDCDFTVVT